MGCNQPSHLIGARDLSARIAELDKKKKAQRRAIAGSATWRCNRRLFVLFFRQVLSEQISVTFQSHADELAPSPDLRFSK